MTEELEGNVLHVKLWMVRVGLFVVVFPALLFWGLLVAPWLGYFLPAVALIVFGLVERRFERWLSAQGILRE